MSGCEHGELFVSSLNLENAYKTPSQNAILDALKSTPPPKNRSKKTGLGKKTSRREQTPISSPEVPSAFTFPPPLVLPGDDLEQDPEYPPQSVQDWVDDEDRNEVTRERKTIWVVPPPWGSPEAAMIYDWEIPKVYHDDKTKSGAPSKKRRRSSAASLLNTLEAEHGTKSLKDIPLPRFDEVVEYLQAFYRGCRVRVFRKPKLQFTKWEEEGKSRKPVASIGLSTGTEVVRIRTRPAPDEIFSTQLNLDDLLDVAIGILPDDAYALLMVVNQDMYENDEDDFCCGRAYGGSRVAVVSTARYRPDLDDVQGVDELQHTWPESHCLQYISSRFSSKANGIAEKMQASISSEERANSAIRAAVSAAKDVPLPTAPLLLNPVWLSRVCKTASHELGHCFGLDHCTYYACIMQSTASLAEDARQPPYLCPVDLAKVLRATRVDEKKRDKALLEFCENRNAERMFAAFAAWIKARMDQGDVPSIAG